MIPTFKQVNNVFYKNKSDYAKIYKENIKLQNPAWDLFAKKYKKIIYVVPTRFPKEYFPLAYFAAKNKLKTNFGYFSRVNKRTVAKKNSELLSKINRNDFDKDSLYIFFNDESWEISRKKNPAITKTIDGYRVLAPQSFLIISLIEYKGCLSIFCIILNKYSPIIKKPKKINENTKVFNQEEAMKSNKNNKTLEISKSKPKTK